MARTNNQNALAVNSLSYDWNKLEGLAVADDYLEGENNELAKRSLETILKGIGVTDPGVLETLTDKEVMKKAIQNQYALYSQGLGTQSVRDRLDYHKEIIEGYLGRDTSKLYSQLGEFLDMNYVDLQQKVLTAKHVLDGAKKGIRTSQENIESAKKTIEKYSKVLRVLTSLEQKKNSEFRNKIENPYYGDVIRNVAADDRQAQAA